MNCNNCGKMFGLGTETTTIVFKGEDTERVAKECNKCGKITISCTERTPKPE